MEGFETFMERCDKAIVPYAGAVGVRSFTDACWMDLFRETGGDVTDRTVIEFLSAADDLFAEMVAVMDGRTSAPVLDLAAMIERNLAHYEAGHALESYTDRYKRRLRLAMRAESADQWQAAATGYATAYAEHPSKWEAEPSEQDRAAREALRSKEDAMWEKHRATLSVGQWVSIPSGMGGTFDGAIKSIEGDRVTIEIEAKATDGFGGKPWSASFRDTKALRR